MPSKSQPTDPGQGERFIDAARKVETDESGKSFEKAFKKIVPKKPTRKSSLPNAT
jgi:hypothetical protein